MEHNIKIIKSQQNKPQITVDNKYIFNYDVELKNEKKNFDVNLIDTII